jgi:hypothetical protein
VREERVRRLEAGHGLGDVLGGGAARQQRLQLDALGVLLPWPVLPLLVVGS